MEMRHLHFPFSSFFIENFPDIFQSCPGYPCFSEAHIFPPQQLWSQGYSVLTPRESRETPLADWLPAGVGVSERSCGRLFSLPVGGALQMQIFVTSKVQYFFQFFFSVCVFASRATVGSRTLACHWLLLLLICIKLNSARLGRTLDGDVTLMNCRGVWERTAVSCLRRSLLPCTGGSALCVNINHYYRANWKKNKKNKYKRNKHFISRQRAEMLDGGPSRWEAPRQSLSHVCLWMNLRK